MQSKVPLEEVTHPVGNFCLLAIPRHPGSEELEKVAKEASLLAGFLPISPDLTLSGFLTRDEGPIVSRVTCIIADLTALNPNVLYEIGLARAMGKDIFLLVKSGERVPFDLQGSILILYNEIDTRKGRLSLIERLVDVLKQSRFFERRSALTELSRPSPTFLVDWDRLERSEAENLCRELLVQMGYRRVDWSKRYREFDLLAELPKKDPDGFEYSEYWLVSMGRNAPIEMVMDMTAEGTGIMRHILRGDERVGPLLGSDQAQVPITILLILLDAGSEKSRIDLVMARQREMRSRRWPEGFRIRIWDRYYLASLMQQFPQLGYKYFSDEGRSQSKYRMTPEELYQENVDLVERQAKLISDLTEEKNKRVRAERDAVWKDISFSAAHKIGNPIFAIETNLDPLKKRISEGRTQEAIDVISRIGVSVEKAKGIVDQFKSLTRAQEIKPVATLLRPTLEDACRTAREQGVLCVIDVPEKIRILADPERLSECFDELVANALHWLYKAERIVHVRATQPAPPPLPDGLDAELEYSLIQFGDNGRGVDLGDKSKIFDAFFTTQEHGTGLGLALVRRIIEGHGGAIFETGIPGEGAEFEIYLPATLKRRAKIPMPWKRRRGKKE